MRDYVDQKFDEDDYLMLSGIQHMAFCERQWALIHIEQAWAENIRTVEGKHLHERADDRFADETRKNVRTVRSMPLISRSLGLRGIADVVEFHKTETEVEGVTVKLKHRNGWWRPYPVEYKRGRPKSDDRDAVQLCAQAIALEEMFCVRIECGFLYYGETKHRQQIEFTHILREHVTALSVKMHETMVEGLTPKAQKGKHCSLCSLIEICQPKLMVNHKPVKAYLERMTHLEVEGR